MMLKGFIKFYGFFNNQIIFAFLTETLHKSGVVAFTSKQKKVQQEKDSDSLRRFE
jgi:hypothetical protein